MSPFCDFVTDKKIECVMMSLSYLPLVSIFLQTLLLHLLITTTTILLKIQRNKNPPAHHVAIYHKNYQSYPYRINVLWIICTPGHETQICICMLTARPNSSASMAQILIKLRYHLLFLTFTIFFYFLLLPHRDRTYFPFNGGETHTICMRWIFWL